MFENYQSISQPFFVSATVGTEDARRFFTTVLQNVSDGEMTPTTPSRKGRRETETFCKTSQGASLSRPSDRFLDDLLSGCMEDNASGVDSVRRQSGGWNAAHTFDESLHRRYISSTLPTFVY